MGHQVVWRLLRRAAVPHLFGLEVVVLLGRARVGGERRQVVRAVQVLERLCPRTDPVLGRAVALRVALVAALAPHLLVDHVRHRPVAGAEVAQRVRGPPVGQLRRAVRRRLTEVRQRPLELARVASAVAVAALLVAVALRARARACALSRRLRGAELRAARIAPRIARAAHRARRLVVELGARVGRLQPAAAARCTTALPSRRCTGTRRSASHAVALARPRRPVGARDARRRPPPRRAGTRATPPRRAPRYEPARQPGPPAAPRRPAAAATGGGGDAARRAPLAAEGLGARPTPSPGRACSARAEECAALASRRRPPPLQLLQLLHHALGGIDAGVDAAGRRGRVGCASSEWRSGDPWLAAEAREHRDQGERQRRQEPTRIFLPTDRRRRAQPGSEITHVLLLSAAGLLLLSPRPSPRSASPGPPRPSPPHARGPAARPAQSRGLSTPVRVEAAKGAKEEEWRAAGGAAAQPGEDGGVQCGVVAAARADAQAELKAVQNSADTLEAWKALGDEGSCRRRHEPRHRHQRARQQGRASPPSRTLPYIDQGYVAEDAGPTFEGAGTRSAGRSGRRTTRGSE